MKSATSSRKQAGISKSMRISIAKIDCVRDVAPDVFFESAPSRAVKTKAGEFRECAPEFYSRMAWKFRVKKVQSPHLVEIVHPDDKARNICVLDGRSYDISTGIGTGFDLPLSGEMKKHSMIFWPRTEECELELLNYANMEDPLFGPAAAQSIEIFELKDGELPSVKPGKAHENGAFRKIGFQWEDPCGKLLSFGARNIEEWASRLADYAAFAGLNLVEYPASWYWGPLYPSKVETPDFMHNALAADCSKIYNVVTNPAADWLAVAIDALAKRGVGFRPVAHLLRLPSLVELGKAQLKSGETSGEACALNRRNDGRLQISTADWTRWWKNSNLPIWADHSQPVGHEPWDVKGLPPGPIYNIFHPATRKALKTFFRELRERYGKATKFSGACVPLWGTTTLWFGSLKSGYDDLSAALFEKERGIALPSGGEERFAKRFDWIMKNRREEWIAWRCAKIKAFMDELAEELGGPLTLSVCHEPLLNHLNPQGLDGASQLFNEGKSLHELCREGGIDFELYKTGPVNIELQLNPSRGRHQHMLEFPLIYREYNFLDKPTSEKLEGGAVSNVIHNCYYEAGTYMMERRDVAEAADWGTGEVVELYKMHLEFKHKIWPWRESEFTTSPGVPPAGRNFLECFAHSLAEHDAQFITHGGLCVGTWGHEEELRDFAEAYKEIPAGAFRKIGKAVDPVALRIQTGAKKNIRFYLVNQSRFNVEARLSFETESGCLTRLPSGAKTYFLEGARTLKLKPFELAVFEAENEKELPSGMEAFASEDEIQTFKKETKALLKDAALFKKSFGGMKDDGSAMNESLSQRLRYLEWIEKGLTDAIKSAELSRWSSFLISLRIFNEKTVKKAKECEANQRKFEESLRKDGTARVNCGSPKEFVDPAGRVWLPDQKYASPASYGQTGAGMIDRGPGLKLEGSPFGRLFQTEAYGSKLCYRLPVENGRWRVKLHFAETWFDKPGKRVFKARATGAKKQVDEFDPFARAGGFGKPVELAFDCRAENGRIDVELFDGEAALNGIEIEKI